MHKTLKFLQDYANATDNFWLAERLKLLEEEIKLEIVEAEIRILKTSKN
jgi:hypothetical protein|tara:strand:- start:1391 stop:1537 length:147 start_codon:yes stop_codon:yes gene_type:complete